MGSDRQTPAAQRPGGERGLRRLWRATGDSLRGLAHAVRREEAFRLECLLAVVLLPLAFILGEDGVERALLAGSVFLVLVVELLNSAVETAVDRIGLEYHRLSGRAKRLGSAAVFLALLNGVVIWLALLL